ncbi:MAG: hypothetical protein Pars92KO_32890 [Parasphingorhabdus sp.]
MGCTQVVLECAEGQKRGWVRRFIPFVQFWETCKKALAKKSLAAEEVRPRHVAVRSLVGQISLKESGTEYDINKDNNQVEEKQKR